MTTHIAAIRDFHHARMARLGTLGIAFFALKGMAWLLLPLVTLYFS